jgi:hypothetical protein
MTIDQVRDLVARAIEPYSKSERFSGLTRWCNEHGVCKSAASQFMSGKRGPSSDLLDALGLEWQLVPARAPRSERDRGVEDRLMAA